MAGSPSNPPLPVSICRIADAILLFFFFFISIAAPLIDAQACVPSGFFPQVLVEVKSWYGREYGDFLMIEKPGFFLGVVWMELLFQWPLAVANVYGIIRERWWYKTTCLMYGVSTCTGMVSTHIHNTRKKKSFFPFLSFYSCQFFALWCTSFLRKKESELIF